MYLTRNIGRWQIEYEQRAIHLTRHPRADPNCAYCLGRGGHGWITESGDADWEDCSCGSPFRTWRLPIGPRAARREAPF